MLLLDEPTNHLDVESIEALEGALTNYDGTVILVSHDRALLRALAARVWVIYSERITDYDGTFVEWEAASAERARAAAIATAEAQQLERVRARQSTRRLEDRRRETTSAARTAAREMEAAEAAVIRLDARVMELTTMLDDPALYVTPAGRARALALGAELESAKRALDEAFQRWEASETTQTLPRT